MILFRKITFLESGGNKNDEGILPLYAEIWSKNMFVL